MELADILILALCAGVGALLVWFEINSRRNQAREKQQAKLAQPTFAPLQKEAPAKAGSKIEKPHAA